MNHGGRESVEVFTVDTTAGRPAATWIGCVVMPKGVWGNGVVALPDGGFAVTKFFDPASRNTFADGGDVRVWRPSAGWSTVQGSELMAPNGIELSPDGKNLYVAVYADRSIVSVPLQGGAVTRVADVPFLPDNLRWTEAGTLLVTGQDFTDGPSIIRCLREGTGCPPGFNIVEIDPVAKSATSIFQTDTREFGFATVAAPVGDEVWVGTLQHDRIARVGGLPLKRKGG
ncbi:MAG TPA: hypothetical protein VH419_09060 [Nocardioidaceae bacterium]